ncbi:hypothetical protein [Pantoea rodasii]|uniref:hypothetical protein n=1 Tax=Pantoea rodasii TaxID=1076549 RepID=UPI0012FDE7FA|nr:hypothetical protein [Pantoea rodasii]
MREFHLKDIEDLLPDTVRQIVDVIGFDATQKLIERFGAARFPEIKNKCVLRTFSGRVY